MTQFKPKIREKFEKATFVIIILFVIINAIIRQDSVLALISAVCGITYTVFAGKGNPVCYLFGITGSGLYGLLSFNSTLWGNLILYAGYYIPMQILGFFKWNKNLKRDKYEIVKSTLPRREFVRILGITVLFICFLIPVLIYLNDSKPYLDGITVVLSIAGMYLTVKRAVEQWFFWMAVNTLSLIMWLNIALNGERVWSTVVMWAVYLILSVYFYIIWKKEIQYKTPF